MVFHEHTVDKMEQDRSHEGVQGRQSNSLLHNW